MDVFCSTATPDYVQKDCGIDRAGVIGVALIELDQTFTDISDDAEWTSKLATSPPSVYIIKSTRGEYPGGTPTEEEGFGRESTQITGAEHELVFEVEGLKENRDFWESVNRKKWKLAFVSNGDLLYYIDTPVTVYAKPNNPRDVKTGAFWMVSAKWQMYDNPVIADAPDDIFE